MNIETVDLLTIFDAVQKEETEAVACLQWYTEEIAARIFNIQTVLDVEKFSIGASQRNIPRLWNICIEILKNFMLNALSNSRKLKLLRANFTAMQI